MEQPDQRLFQADLLSADFRNGVLNGWWGRPEKEMQPTDLTWPRVIFWIEAATRAGAPDRFYLSLDAAGYRSVAPTGTFWDPATNAALDLARRPKGKPDSRFAKVFRTDWNNTVFYHPYDRVAAQSHPNWTTEQPHLVWTADHTITDYLAEFHALLNSGDYLGV
ncbi:MAG TPA: hypothetical protein VFV19_18705 [Candidatus Polarisedimenticolaceae bacterium]|nr:hypothetical protein [Candidatus Polarisedimenticolaceae bacterium]